MGIRMAKNRYNSKLKAYRRHTSQANLELMQAAYKEFIELCTHVRNLSWNQWITECNGNINSIKLAVEEETNPATSNNINPSTCDDVTEMKSQTDGIHCTIKRDITSRSRLGGSKSHTRVSSISPNRQRGMKGSKFDTPLLKDFLRKQVKLSGHVSTVHSQPEKSARPEYNTPPSVNQFTDASQESDIDSGDNI